MKHIILASTSNRRQEILRWLGVQFEIVPSNFDEEAVKFSDFDDPEEYVATIAAGKAYTVLQLHPNALIIASDTMVFLDGVMHGKPKDLSHARNMMKTFSGKTHTVYTAVVMMDGESGDRRTEIVSSHVTFFTLTDDEIERYISTSEPYDKAGGYALQGYAKKFVREVKGSAMNVVGFPVLTVRDMLEEFGIEIEVDIEESVFQKTGFRS